MTSLWMQTAPPIPQDDEPPPAETQVVIVGAGMTGLSLAVMLGEAGVPATVLEGRQIGAVATGNTTGKLCLLQGRVFSEMREHARDDVLRAYADANRAGQEWLLAQVADEPGCAEPKVAITWADTEDGVATLAREAEAMAAAGVEVEQMASPDLAELTLPFTPTAALRLGGQAQLQPVRVLAVLARRARSAGVRIVEGCRVTAADVTGEGVVLETSRGQVRAQTVVLATGTPVLNRGLYFAKLLAERSFAAAYALGDSPPLPDGMFLSVDPVAHSLRTAEGTDGGRVLVVGGGNHRTGRDGDTAALVDEIDAWTKTHWPGARRVTWWAAQDYRAVTRVPYAGPIPRGGGRIHAATGYHKWGMTNAVAAALRIAWHLEIPGHLAGSEAAWARVLADHHAGVTDAGDAVVVNAEVAAHLTGGWARAEASGRHDDPPAEGAGRIVRSGVSPVAESTVDGATCRVSGVCTHLGGILTWNSAERSWDCPLHGSRFDARGQRLEGPALADLAPA
ncbi:FAD-dependent oxidoreductase [Microbacterium deminutum]|uniref:FAD-dependent oxidoreductase n=1 Tax=Microbacterium deminutum TaxID=344164 RepID=A0ABN2Q388_9MICO